MTQLTDREEAATGVVAPPPPAVPRLPGVRFRPFAGASDYDVMAELIKACNLHDDIPWLPTAGNLRSEMENRTSFDAARDLLIVELDGQTIGLTGVEREVRDGNPIYEPWGSVLPE